MELVRKLPFVLGCLAAMTVGVVNYFYDADSQIIFFRMAATMIIFFIIGVFVKSTILSIKTEVEKKENIQQNQQNNSKQHSVSEPEKYTAPIDSLRNGQSQAASGQFQTGQKINLVAEDEEDAFQPMTVGRVIRNKLKE